MLPAFRARRLCLSLPVLTVAPICSVFSVSDGQKHTRSRQQAYFLSKQTDSACFNYLF